jgi:hypothetical protein
MDRQRSGNYRSLLEEAFGMGRADGPTSAADEVGAAGSPPGFDADEFAALLWAPRPGTPPAGLVLNAPHWYAAGRRSAPSVRPSPAVPRPRQHGAADRQRT